MSFDTPASPGVTATGDHDPVSARRIIRALTADIER